MSRAWCVEKRENLKVGQRVKVETPSFDYNGRVDEIREDMIVIKGGSDGECYFELLDEDVVYVLKDSGYWG